MMFFFPWFDIGIKMEKFINIEKKRSTNWHFSHVFPLERDSFIYLFIW